MSIAQPQVHTAPVQEPRYLSGPITDFLMLGGATLLIFPLLLALPTDTFESPIALFAFWMAFAINHPHFAVSYRIFYEDFGRKIAAEGQSDTTLRYRYIVAGIIAPLVLLGGLGAVAVTGSRELLGASYNIMGFFVGWHYVKQGYGMAMVDAALKRRYLPAFDKKVLLVNGYAVWAFAYAMLNRTSEPLDFFGLSVTRFDLPDIVAWSTGVVMAVTTAAVVFTLAKRALHGKPTAWIGIVAYMVTLYLWMVLVRTDPLFILVTPALHSMQYLWVVQRFQRNRHEADPTNLRWRSQFGRSVVLGACMFFIFPIALFLFFDLDAGVWGATPFLFMFVVFVNIHHYFLDNVMWRRGNAEVSQHLFA